MSKYKLIIFDLDGTMLDTTNGILKSIKETVSHYKLPELNDKVIQGFIGPPIQNSLEEHYGLIGSHLQEVTNYFRNLYSKDNLYKAEYVLCHKCHNQSWLQP
jgi:phosphoglycolate phosphatase